MIQSDSWEGTPRWVCTGSGMIADNDLESQWIRWGGCDPANTTCLRLACYRPTMLRPRLRSLLEVHRHTFDGVQPRERPDRHARCRAKL